MFDHFCNMDNIRVFVRIQAWPLSGLIFVLIQYANKVALSAIDVLRNNSMREH